MSTNEKYEKYINSDGIITTADIAKAQASKKTYYNFLKTNNFKKIAPGVYATSDVFVDSLALINKRSPIAVISHDEALYHYGLIDREPETPTLTIYSGYNANRLKAAGYKVFFVKKELLNVGKEYIKDYYGNVVPMYNLERTICDLIRNRNSFEIQDFITAIKSYVRRNDKNITNLYDYAKLFRIERLVNTYMEVLL